MANPEHLAILKQGVKVLNKWREENQGVVPDFYRADLRGADLYNTNLREADLREADLRETDLRGAHLSRAYLNKANLRAVDLSRANLGLALLIGACLDGANLHGASLLGAKLERTNLSDANLQGTNLTDAKLLRANLSGVILHEANLSIAVFVGGILSGADFMNARCSRTMFVNVDLSETKNLDSITHHGPSTIGIDALYKSKGNIPEVFLRGCGVPDQMIEYARSLTGSPIEYYSCFISYSSKDEEFARRVHNDLQAAGVRCWFAPHDIQAGKKIHHQIDEAIRFYDKLLLILSPDSMNSNWVGSEIIRAKKKEDRQDSQMLFPLSIVPFQKIKDWEFFDSDSGRDLAREIREYFIPDFSLWKSDHDAYSKAFDRLLRDLKAG